MRALLVDPFKREVREVDVPEGYQAIQQFVGGGELGEKRAPFSAGPRFSDDTISWVDDEGIYRPDQAWFRMPGYPHPLAGYMLVQGSEGPNEVALPSWLTVQLLQSRCIWIDPKLGEQLVQPTTITTLDRNMQPVGDVEVIHHDLSTKRPIGGG